LKPTAAIAPDALLPANPGDALAIAQDLLQAPLMSNHHHGLWGYHGETAAGRALTVQSTGIGGPSAAAVLAELAELGVRRAVRIGACEPLEGRLDPGAVLVAEAALAGDGTSTALGVTGTVAPTPALAEALLRAGGEDAVAGTVASLDVPELVPSHDGALAADLESAALLAQGRRVGVDVAAVLFTPIAGESDQAPETVLRAARIARDALAG